jgi:DNA-binding MarR family transcriptional regulator
VTTENVRLHTALIGCSSAHKKSSMQEFQKMNLTTGQPKVLSILSKKEGYLQKDLAARCHVEPATLTSLLNKMEENDLIFKKQEYVSGNKRAFAIYLTEKGHDMAVKVNQIIDEMETISFQGFDDNDKQLLIGLLNRVQANLEKNS